MGSMNKNEKECNLKKELINESIIILFRTRCYIVTRCTNLVSVHYFLPLGI